MWLYVLDVTLAIEKCLYRGTISPCTAPEPCADSNLKFWNISLLWDQREKYKVSLRLFGLSGILIPQQYILRGQKYWIPSCIVWGIRNSECSSVFLGDQKFWILSCVIWGIRNSESPVLFWGSEILNLLCCLGDQKLWILSCVLGGSEVLNPLLCLSLIHIWRCRRAI